MEYIVAPKSLTFYWNNEAYTVTSDHLNFTAIRNKLIAGDNDGLALSRLASVRQAVEAAVSSAEAGHYLTPGKVTIRNGEVLYDGIPVHSSLTDRMMGILGAQGSGGLRPWIKFMEKLYLNPNHSTRFELYDWMDNCKMPLTSDGDFLAYKKVREDYKDVHSGTFSNAVGQVVALDDRRKVDPNRNNHCSAGLHFASSGYLPNFGGKRVVIVKINPADVVSIPTDYNFTKGRCWKYHVMGEILEPVAMELVWPPVVPWTVPDSTVINSVDWNFKW